VVASEFEPPEEAEHYCKRTSTSPTIENYFKMKISILEMCQILLLKIRKLEQDIRYVLKINQDDRLHDDIEFPIDESKMKERRKRTSNTKKMMNHPDPKKTTRKTRKRFKRRNNNQSGKQRKNQVQAQGNQQGPPQQSPQQEVYQLQDVHKNITRTSTPIDRDQNLKEDPKINSKDQSNPKFQPENPKEKRKVEEKKGPNNNQEIADKLREQARKEMENKNYDDGKKLCDKAEKYSPKDARILANMCICTWHQKDFGNCFEIAKEIISNEDLDYREKKLIYNMNIKLINSALILERFKVAYQYAKKAINQFNDPEIEKLFQKCKNFEKGNL